jgi:transposase
VGLPIHGRCDDESPSRGGATGPNPTDRGKSGTKRSVQTDGAGVPIGVAIDGANRHDSKLLKPTIESIPIKRAKATKSHPQGMCLDKGYDYPFVQELLDTFGYAPHIRSRGEEKTDKTTIPKYRARRWVVERTHSWINRYRRLLIRWEKKPDNYLAFLIFVCGIVAFRAAGVFG